MGRNYHLSCILEPEWYFFYIKQGADAVMRRRLTSYEYASQGCCVRFTSFSDHQTAVTTPLHAAVLLLCSVMYHTPVLTSMWSHLL